MITLTEECYFCKNDIQTFELLSFSLSSQSPKDDTFSVSILYKVLHLKRFGKIFMAQQIIIRTVRRDCKND